MVTFINVSMFSVYITEMFMTHLVKKRIKCNPANLEPEPQKVANGFLGGSFKILLCQLVTSVCTSKKDSPFLTRQGGQE